MYRTRRSRPQERNLCSSISLPIHLPTYLPLNGPDGKGLPIPGLPITSPPGWTTNITYRPTEPYKNTILFYPYFPSSPPPSSFLFLLSRILFYPSFPPPPSSPSSCSQSLISLLFSYFTFLFFVFLSSVSVVCVFLYFILPFSYYSLFPLSPLFACERNSLSLSLSFLSDFPFLRPFLNSLLVSVTPVFLSPLN